MEPKQNWFDTLNLALESENLIEAWDVTSPGIAYDETRSWPYVMVEPTNWMPLPKAPANGASS